MKERDQNHTAADLLERPDRGRDGDGDDTARELLQLITDWSPGVSYVTLCPCFCCSVYVYLVWETDRNREKQKVKYLVPEVLSTTMNHPAN